MTKLIEDLNWRYACKQFDSSKKISDTDFKTLLESLRLTASSFGLQPWKFVVVENTELRKKLVDVSWGQAQVKDASHLIVMCAPAALDENFVDRYISDIAKTRGQEISDLAGFKKMLMMIPNKSDEAKLEWAKNQIYIAMGTLLTACASMRIDSCPMEGFQAAKYDEILGLASKGLRSVLVCPVGYRDKADKYIDIKKVRFSQEELIVTI